MATAKQFEDLEVWQKGRDVVNTIYQAFASAGFSRDYVLRDQIRRAAISSPPNIAESFTRHSNREFIPFLFVSKGSAAEVQSQLYTTLDQDYISQKTFDNIYEVLAVVAKQRSRLITDLKREQLTQ